LPHLAAGLDFGEEMWYKNLKHLEKGELLARGGRKALDFTRDFWAAKVGVKITSLVL
jgi:hypothetical protein